MQDSVVPFYSNVILNDSHSYCLADEKAQYQEIIKRCVLNRCLCRLYHYQGISCPIPHYDKRCILELLNSIARTPQGPEVPEGLQHVRRKLFRDHRIRKMKRPQKDASKRLSVFQFKNQGIHKSMKIRRGYLNVARQQVKVEILTAIQRQWQARTAEYIKSSLFDFDYFAQSILGYYMHQQRNSQNVNSSAVPTFQAPIS